jgi:flagellar biosynthetic protein FlhB
MTKQEVKDERRQMEGDPLVKSRIRSKQLDLARRRMMAEVPDATVVVTNPTHVAVALRYEPGQTDVPRVVAKGQELLAQRIREIASAHGVPIVSDPPLARALYRSVAVGAFVPVAMFHAVAEVLAMVWRRRRPDRPTVEKPSGEERP